LGFHLRDISQPAAGGGAGSGQLHALVLWGSAHYFFPEEGGGLLSGYVFAFFAGMMVLQLIWVKTMVPETKGVPLEEIQRRLGIE
jgi:hypothetical protein